jgi:hypothetical protein
MSEYPSTTRSGALSQWDVYVERLRAQLPEAPEALLNGYVRWAPWVAIVFGVMGLLSMLALLGLSAVLAPLFVLFGGFDGAQAGGQLIFSVLFGLVLAAAEVAGGNLMRQMRATGWWILAMGLVISVLTSLVRVSAVSLVLTLLVAYLHILVRPRYS